MKQKQTTFYCFSPPVMVATFVIEVTFLVMVIAKYTLKTTKNRLIAALLFFLALFQLAEYNVCGRFNIDAMAWSRIGFIAITMLPPLGFHLMRVIAGKKWNHTVLFAYATALCWVLLFGFSSKIFRSHQCEGNYVIFRLLENTTRYYGLYYYGWLLATVVGCFRLGARAKKPTKTALNRLAAGYLLFLVPTITAITLFESASDGIPSIMCGFAVLFAVMLTFGVAPFKQHITKYRKKH